MDNMPDDAKLQECYQGYLLGEYDDTPKTAAWASLICGAPEQDIKDMAAIMSKQNNVILATGTAAARCTGVENLSPGDLYHRAHGRPYGQAGAMPCSTT